MPIPLSATEIYKQSSKFKVTLISPLGLENLIAFDNRFNIILSSLSASTFSITSSLLVSKIKFKFLDSA